MKYFDDLGRTILDRWQRADFDGRAFPDVAASALTERPPSAHVDPMEVVQWVQDTDAIVRQEGPLVKFGEPAITVYRNEGFYIDVLFWVDGTTAIHQHGFSGAFHVMQGGSIESVYDFAPTRRYSERLMLGDLALREVHHLKRGDVRPILAGTQFIHALFHLERPSVSVVVRTPNDPVAGPQYSYVRPGIAFDPFHETDSMRRRWEILRLLSRSTHAEFEARARATVQRVDAFTAFHLATRLRGCFHEHAAYLAFLDSVRPSHDALIDALRIQADDDRRSLHLMTRRALAKSAEHRFFLALLLNLHDRARILEGVRTELPDREPVKAIVTWITELAKLDEVAAWVGEMAKATAARILDFRADAVTLDVARAILEGRWAGPADEAQAGALRALRESLVVGNLFA